MGQPDGCWRPVSVMVRDTGTVLHHRDPYGVESVARDSGSLLWPCGRYRRRDRGRDEQRFACPVHVVFFLAPAIERWFSEARCRCWQGWEAVAGSSWIVASVLAAC
jgi:hypothetical protein